MATVLIHGVGSPDAMSLSQRNQARAHASWALKHGWRAEHLGWFDAEGQPKGAALVLYRQLPGLRRSFAYIPEGPVVNLTRP